MTPEEYWAYKAFVRDDATEGALRSSEVFMAYREAELKREAELQKRAEADSLKEKADALHMFEVFDKKVASSPTLKAKFKQIKAHLDANPDVAAKVDPNFIEGISMLNLDDEE